MKLKAGVLAVIISTVAGCGGDGVPQVQFWNFGGTPNYHTWIAGQVNGFNGTHQGVRVVKSQKSWNMIRELLYTNFSAGTGPDIVTVHANYAAEFGSAGYFLPLETFPDFDKVSSLFVPNIMETTRYEGKHYGLPFSALVFVLVCNREMFDAEGIDPPRTWSQFRDAARRLTKDNDGDGSIDQWGLVLLGGDRGGFSYRLAPLMFKAGADILSDDLSRAVFDSPEAVSALALLADMYQVDKSITPGFLAYTLSEINDLFSSNRVAMSIEGPWFRPMVDEKAPGKEFYTVPVPVPDDRIDQYQTAPSLQDLVMFSISSQSKSPEQAWEFVKSVRTYKADLQWLAEPMGGLPTVTRVWESEDAPARLDAFEVFRNELEHARPWPAHPKIISIVRNLIAPLGEKAIVGEMTPEEAMHSAVEQAQQLLDE